MSLFALISQLFFNACLRVDKLVSIKEMQHRPEIANFSQSMGWVVGPWHSRGWHVQGLLACTLLTKASGKCMWVDTSK